jgi:hypothetical protein
VEQEREMVRSNNRQVGVIRAELAGIKKSMADIAETLSFVRGFLERETDRVGLQVEPEERKPINIVRSPTAEPPLGTREAAEVKVKVEPGKTPPVAEGHRVASLDPLGHRTCYEHVILTRGLLAAHVISC